MTAPADRHWEVQGREERGVSEWELKTDGKWLKQREIPCLCRNSFELKWLLNSKKSAALMPTCSQICKYFFKDKLAIYSAIPDPELPSVSLACKLSFKHFSFFLSMPCTLEGSRCDLFSPPGLRAPLSGVESVQSKRKPLLPLILTHHL